MKIILKRLYRKVRWCLFFFFNIIARPSSSTYRSRKRLFPVSGLQNAGPYIVEEGSKEKMEKEKRKPCSVCVAVRPSRAKKNANISAIPVIISIWRRNTRIHVFFPPFFYDMRRGHRLSCVFIERRSLPGHGVIRVQINKGSALDGISPSQFRVTRLLYTTVSHFLLLFEFIVLFFFSLLQ